MKTLRGSTPSPLRDFFPAAGWAAVLPPVNNLRGSTPSPLRISSLRRVGGGASPDENLWDKQKPGLLLETGWFAVYFTTVPG